jgi:diguanylate cyclase (GGDEF)-like protein
MSRRSRVPVTDQSARSGRPGLTSAGIVALVGGLLGPWLEIPYFRVGPVSAGVLDLPGGTAYAAVVAVFVIGATRRGARRRTSRLASLVMAVGLAVYSGFWLLGALVLDLKSDFSLSYPSFGFGLLLSFTGSVLSVLVIQAQAARREKPTTATEQDDQGSDLTLPKETDSRSSELASCEKFLDQLRALSTGGTGHETVPLVFVRPDGLKEIHDRYGSPAADRISVAMAHRLRAQLREGDAVARFLTGEVFILPYGEISEDNAMLVVRRLEAILAKPIPSVKRRHAKLLAVTVQLAKARFTNGRIEVVVDDECLIDAPIVSSGRTGGVEGSRPGLSVSG